LEEAAVGFVGVDVTDDEEVASLVEVGDDVVDFDLGGGFYVGRFVHFYERHIMMTWW
jgi:myo-inositol-hexaphosphate 3-phosphohydrolase